MTESTNEFWKEAYKSNIGKLIGICYRYTRNYQLSEDLAHDAFLKAIDKYGTFNGDGKFEAWLRRIVVNQALQYLRGRKKDFYLDELPEVEQEDSVVENIDPVKSMEFTTSALIETIDQLPEHHRLVFNLYVLEEFTHAQIGKELGISEGTSKSHLARARKKLKQLLIQKAEEDQNGKDNRKALLLLLVGDTDENMDQMFRQSLDEFSIPPKNPLSLDKIQFHNPNTFSNSTFLKSNVKILGTSVILAISVAAVLFANQKEKAKEHLPVIDKVVSDTAANNLTSSQPQTATVSKDTVIPERNLKQKQMKPLDSLALMLVLSAVQLNDASAKDSVKNEIEKYSHVEAKLSPNSLVDSLELNDLKIPNSVQKESGSFRASELYWSGDNNELYFKGRVRVNFKDQHFQGNGSFTFLGKIHLLVVDGQQVTLGKKLKLADADYELVILDSKEASEKYGDKGASGAVEISRAN